ncbi:MAG: SDR family oxidoreductase [Desulfocapsaceae bacterium]|nr:SDR family oxidoreductase [Desulfocapsaceae bacterium]
MNILVTGGTGFIGRALLAGLLEKKAFAVRTAVRRAPEGLPAGVGSCRIDGLGPGTDWREAVQACQVVVHCAARVHVMEERAADPLQEFRRVNVQGTLRLARQAAEAGVGRFVFISSIKVNGEETPLDRPFTEDDRPAPEDPYGISKYEAEEGLRRLAAKTGMEVVIIRPPLVYGPGVKGNFQRLIRWVDWGLPLPLGAVQNKRSFVGLDNLADLTMTCIDHPAAGGQTFLAGDGEDLSTPELLRRVALALGKPARLLPVPQAFLQGMAALLGRRAMVKRLCGSLRVDIGKARSLLGWRPPLSVDEGLRRMVRERRDDEAGL